MRTLLAAVLRGMRSRALLSAGSVLLTALAVASAVLGPSFQVAVSRSYAIARVAQAPTPLTGLTWELRPEASLDGDPDAARALATAALEDRGTGPFRLRPQLETLRLPGLTGEVSLLAKDGACERLRDDDALEGRCPAAAGEVAVLGGDLERTGLAVGDATEVEGVGQVEVVGSYQAPEVSDAFWFDTLRFTSSPARSDDRTGVSTPYRPAPLLTDDATFEGLPADRWLVRVDGPLVVPETWTLADLPRAVGIADRLGEVDVAVDGGRLVGTSTNDLAAVAAEVRTEQETARSSVAPAVLSLVLVALALLLRLLVAASELRVPELALASLRGVTAGRLWGLGLAEPLALLVLAAPLGLALGAAGAWALVRAWLVPGLPVPIPAGSIAAALLVVVAAGVVAVVAVGLVLRVSLAGQLAGARRPTAASRWSLLAQLVLVAAALAVLAGTAGGGRRDRPDATDLVLPVLLAVAAGLVAVRATGAAARWWTTRRRRTRSLGAFVAVRALSRRSEGTLVVLPLTAAVAVAVFSVGVADAAATWRGSVAATRAPAGEVWSSPLGLNATVDLTHQVDPEGSWLMTASAAALGSTRLSVVDAPRLARVASWPDSWTPGTDVAEVADDLDTAGTLPVLRGRRLTLAVESDVATGPEDPDVHVELRLRPLGQDTRREYVGPFGPRSSARRSVALPCADGCVLEGLSVGGPAALPLPLDGQVLVRGLEMDGDPVPGALGGAGWGPSPGAGADSPLRDVSAGPDGLRLGVSDERGPGVARLSAGGIPARLPVVVGLGARSGLAEADGGPVLELPTGDLEVAPVLTAESTPFTGPAGILVDATLLTNDRTFYDSALTTTVLARPDTPAGVRDALASRGLTVTSTGAGERRTLDASAYALALRLYLVVAALVLLMALAGLVVSTAVQLPRRRRDAASLRVVGVPRRAVAGSVLRELSAVLGAAAVAGIAAGTLAQLVVLRTITLGTVDALATPRVVADVDPLRLLVTTLLAVAVLGGVAGASALATVRGERAGHGAGRPGCHAARGRPLRAKFGSRPAVRAGGPGPPPTLEQAHLVRHATCGLCLWLS